jgi:hypothetical protein
MSAYSQVFVAGFLIPMARLFNFVPRSKIVLSIAALGVLDCAWLTGTNAPVIRCFDFPGCCFVPIEPSTITAVQESVVSGLVCGTG